MTTFDVSNRVIGPAPDWPAISRVQVSCTPQASGVTVRWVIDRLCLAEGEVLATACAIDSSLLDSAADDRYRLVKSEVRPVLRVSVRATGPRGTQAFFQTTLTR